MDFQAALPSCFTGRHSWMSPLHVRCSPHLAGPPGAFPNGSLFWWELLMLCFFQYWSFDKEMKEMSKRLWKCENDYFLRHLRLALPTERGKKHSIFSQHKSAALSHSWPWEAVSSHFLLSFKCLSLCFRWDLILTRCLPLCRYHNTHRGFLNACCTLRHSFVKSGAAKS